MRPTHDRVRARAVALLFAPIIAVAGCGAADGPAPSAASAAASSGATQAAPGDSAAPSVSATPAGSAPASQGALPPEVAQANFTAADAGVLATATVGPDGGTVSGTTADGVTYTLTVPKLALLEPVEIAIHPLTGSTDLGPIVAGADFTPHGLSFVEPATLEITGLASVPADTVAFGFDGAPGSGKGRLAIAPRPSASSITVLVPHFSGSVAVDVGKNANELYDKWIAARGDGSPAGRMAAAEVRYAGAVAALGAKRISTDTADSIKAGAMADWQEAAIDATLENPALAAMVDNPTEESIGLLDAEVGKAIAFAKEIAKVCDTCASPISMAQVASLWRRLLTGWEDKILGSAATEKEATSGRISDMEHVDGLIEAALNLARRLQLLGLDDAEVKSVMPLMSKQRDALLKSCKQAPLDPAVILRFERFFAILGEMDSKLVIGDLSECQKTGPTAPASAFTATGKVHVTMTVNYEWGDDVLDADLNLVLKLSPETGKLVFASGSTMDVAFTSPEPPCSLDCAGWKPECPALVAGVSERGLALGSPGENGADPASAPNPAVLGEVIGGTGGKSLMLQVTLPRFGSGDCTWGMVPLMCPQAGYLVGQLVGAKPEEWSFACSVPGDGYFISAGGRVVGG